jgi:hypothetical protein
MTAQANDTGHLLTRASNQSNPIQSNPIQPPYPPSGANLAPRYVSHLTPNRRVTSRTSHQIAALRLAPHTTTTALRLAPRTKSPPRTKRRRTPPSGSSTPPPNNLSNTLSLTPHRRPQTRIMIHTTFESPM